MLCSHNFHRSFHKVFPAFSLNDQYYFITTYNLTVNLLWISFSTPFYCIVLPPQLSIVQIKDLYSFLPLPYPSLHLQGRKNRAVCTLIHTIPCGDSPIWIHFISLLYSISHSLVPFRVSSFLRFQSLSGNFDWHICDLFEKLRKLFSHSASQHCPAESCCKALSYLGSQLWYNLIETWLGEMQSHIYGGSSLRIVDFTTHDPVYKELYWILTLLIFWPINLPRCWLSSF